jgi:hypothetical protein
MTPTLVFTKRRDVELFARADEVLAVRFCHRDCITDTDSRLLKGTIALQAFTESFQHDRTALLLLLVGAAAFKQRFSLIVV